MGKHVHHDLIIDWAKGNKIEWFDTVTEKWIEVESPTWVPNIQYRIKEEERHPHQELIETHKRGEKIQLLNKDGIWADIENPVFLSYREYRVKPKEEEKHPHQELIDAYNRGEKIQFLNELSGNWQDIETPNWLLDTKYRIKPKEKKARYLTMEEAADKFIGMKVKSNWGGDKKVIGIINSIYKDKSTAGWGIRVAGGFYYDVSIFSDYKTGEQLSPIIYE